LPKYTDISNIPAKNFFEILKSKDYYLLEPTAIEKTIIKVCSFLKIKYFKLEKTFVKIYDDFFIKSDNNEAKKYLELTKQIAFLNYKMSTLKQYLHFYFYNKTTQEMRYNFIDALEKGYDIIIDKELNFIDEVQRVLSVEVGVIKNDLTFAELEFEQMVKKSKSKNIDYFDSIGALANVLPNNSLLKEDMTLAVYISLEKNAHRIIEAQNNKNKK
jgi:hypothetical protein